MKSKAVLKPGDIVQATHVITDKDNKGRHYIHAIPGTLGVVLDDDFDPDYPVIEWHGPSGRGVCNVPLEVIEKFDERLVYCVVD